MITCYETVLYQLFQVLLAHTGERIGERIPGNRHSWKITVYSHIVNGTQHYVTEKLILPPFVLFLIRFQGVIQFPRGNEVFGITNKGLTVFGKDLLLRGRALKNCFQYPLLL